MPDAFTLLGMPRVAALDESALRQAWLEAGRATHPDLPGGDTARSAEVNAAFETLQAPEKRLKHLLELYRVPWHSVPIDEAMMALFSRLGAALQEVASFLKRKQSATTALSRALLSPEEMRWRETLEHLIQEIEAGRAACLAALPELDTRLQTGDESVLATLQAMQARLAYYARWQAQARESLLALM